MAEGAGAKIIRLPHNDAEKLERLLEVHSESARLICMDGVNSMTGNIPDLPRFASPARKYNAILYVDDAHGFGLIGENLDSSTP